MRKIWSGWQLSGVVELDHEGITACLGYVITCSRSWQTRECEVTGFVGEEPAAVYVQRDFAGEWNLGARSLPELSGCDDIDLAFSPMTNLLPIRRLALPVGSSAQVRAAWLRFPELNLEALQQTYTRVSANRYLYESADGTFRRELTVDETGLVLDYPGLWTTEGPFDHFVGMPTPNP